MITKMVNASLYRQDPKVAVELFDEVLQGRTTGVVVVTAENVSGTDLDEKINVRITKWLQERVGSEEGLEETKQLLLDFYYFLSICEAERQSL